MLGDLVGPKPTVSRPPMAAPFTVRLEGSIDHAFKGLRTIPADVEPARNGRIILTVTLYQRWTPKAGIVYALGEQVRTHHPQENT